MIYVFEYMKYIGLNHYFLLLTLFQLELYHQEVYLLLLYCYYDYYLYLLYYSHLNSYL